MYQKSSRCAARGCPMALAWAITISALFFSAPVQAQLPNLRSIAGFFDIGGYWFTGGSTSRDLGNPKFYSDTAFFVHSMKLGGFRLTGGVQLVSAADHFFPFSGGNEYSLVGPSVRVSTPRVMNRLRFVVTTGLYAQHLRLDRKNIDTYLFAPSIEFGVELPFARYFTVTAGYRLSPSIDSYDTSGFNLGLRFF